MIFSMQPYQIHSFVPTILSLYEHINAAIKSSKIKGPSTTIIFLGIYLDTMEASITLESKAALLAELN